MSERHRGRVLTDRAAERITVVAQSLGDMPAKFAMLSRELIATERSSPPPRFGSASPGHRPGPGGPRSAGSPGGGGNRPISPSTVAKAGGIEQLGDIIPGGAALIFVDPDPPHIGDRGIEQHPLRARPAT